MKTFDQSKDVVYTFSTINESITSGFASFIGAAFGAVDQYPDLQSMQVSPSKLVKTYIHWSSGSLSGGYYQTVFDRDFNDVNSVPIFDITIGSSISSSFNGSDAVGSNFVKQKQKIYRKFAQQLLGDPNKIFQFKDHQCHDVGFVLFKRNQFKDKITTGRGSYGIASGFINTGSIKSYIQSTVFNKVDVSPEVSERGTTSDIVNRFDNPVYCGKVFHEHGVVAYDLLNVSNTSSVAGNEWFVSGTLTSSFTSVYKTANAGMTLNSAIDAFRTRLQWYSINNYSKMRNTVYTCTAEREEFNYSSNPSFVNVDGQIITTSGSASPGMPITYITRVGLLGPNGELIAQGALSKPIRKDFNRKVTIKVRLDF